MKTLYLLTLLFIFSCVFPLNAGAVQNDPFARSFVHGDIVCGFFGDEAEYSEANGGTWKSLYKCTFHNSQNDGIFVALLTKEAIDERKYRSVRFYKKTAGSANLYFYLLKASSGLLKYRENHFQKYNEEMLLLMNVIADDAMQSSFVR